MRHISLLLAAGCLFSPLINAAEQIAVDIPAQAMSSALEQLGRQTGLQILYPAEALAGKTSPRISGRYTPQQALDKLLSGSRLHYQFADEQTVAINGENHTAENPAISNDVSDNLVALDKIVVTATKTEHRLLDVPATVSMVDQHQIGQMYNRDLTDVLSRTAGIDSQRMGTNGISSINIRGLGYGRSSTLINGQFADFLDNGIGNRSALQTIDWDNVERVEVVRGAGSALYGPNAMGGVVNVITKDIPNVPNVTKPFFLFDSLPTYGGGFSTGGNEGDIGYFLDFKHLNSDGYKAAPNPAMMAGASGTSIHSLQNGAWDKTMAGGKLKWKISDMAELKFGFNYLDDRANAFDRPNTISNGQYGQYSLDYSHWLSYEDQLTVNLSYRDHQADLGFDGYFYPFFSDLNRQSILTEDAKKLSGEIRNRWNIAEGHTLLVGFYGSQDWTKRSSFDVPTQSISDSPNNSITNYALYGQYELALWDRLYITMGGRGDWFEYELSNPATARSANQSYAVFNPRGGLRFKFSDEFSVRASVGTGFRPPAPYSLTGAQSTEFYEVRPNPDLKPETSDSFDLGFDWITPFDSIISATAYYNDLSDYQLQSVFSEGGKTIYQSRNLGKVTSYGAELEIQQRITSQFSLFVNYTYSISEAASQVAPGVYGLPDEGRQLPLTPRNKATFGLVFESERFSGRLEGRYVDNQYIFGDTKNDPAYALDSYVTADFRLNYRHPIGNGKTLELSGGVRNLLDRRYETRFVNTFGGPRVGFIQIGLEF